MLRLIQSPPHARQRVVDVKNVSGAGAGLKSEHRKDLHGTVLERPQAPAPGSYRVDGRVGHRLGRLVWSTTMSYNVLRRWRRYRSRRVAPPSALDLATAARLLDVVCGPDDPLNRWRKNCRTSAGLVDVEQQGAARVAVCRRQKARRITRYVAALHTPRIRNERRVLFALHDPWVAAVHALRRQLEHRRLAGPLGHLRAFDLE